MHALSATHTALAVVQRTLIRLAVAFACAVCLCALGADMYIRYAMAQFVRPRVVLVDANNRRIAGALLRFRDAHGNVFAAATTDDRGEFRMHDLRRVVQFSASVDGYGFAQYRHSTGGSDAFVYSPLRLQEARVHLPNGQPVSGLDLTAYVDQHTYSPGGQIHTYSASTGRDGIARLGVLPSCARFVFVTGDPHYAVSACTPVITGSRVRYDVTVTKAGAVTGRILLDNGTPARNVIVQAFPTCPPGTSLARNFVGVTGADGRYWIFGLAPGLCRLGIGLNPDAQPVAITVRRNETVRAADLHLSEPAGSGGAPR